MIDRYSYTQSLRSCEIETWKKDMNGIQAHGLCDSSVAEVGSPESRSSLNFFHAAKDDDQSCLHTMCIVALF